MKFQVATEPTQLEIKTLIESLEANNGLLVDNVGKKYLPVMNDIYDFRTIEGENSLAPLQESLKTKFPDLASSINVSDIIQKYHIENNIHFMYYNEYIIIVDMTALEVLNAVMISNDTPNWFGATGNNFIDDNYIYIRGYNKVQQVAIFAVFNRFTYEYIRTIGWNGGSGTLGSYSTPFTGEMVRFGQYFMAALGDANVIQVCKINYDSFGKPSSFSGIGQTYYYTGNAQANAFWGDDNDNVYVLWTISTNSFGMERKKFDRSNGKLTLVASNNLTNVTVPSIRSLWCFKYKFDNKNLILIAFGNGSSSNSMVINYDDLTVHQYVNGAVLMRYPLFDYQNKNLMYIQSYTITGYQIDGNGYDILQEYQLIDGKWKGSNICVPAIKYMNQNDFGRTLYAGDQYGYIRDGKVYVTAFSRHFRLLTKSNIISHYKEVLK